MADAIVGQVRRYVLDGSDEDLRRLLSLSESFAEHARRAFRRVGVGPGWTVIDCGCGPRPSTTWSPGSRPPRQADMSG